MNINFDELLQQEAFRNLDPVRKKAFSELADKLIGKNANESMPIVMNFLKNLPPGPALSTDEQNAMMHAMVISLPDEEAAKFQSIMKMVRFMNK